MRSLNPIVFVAIVLLCLLPACNREPEPVDESPETAAPLRGASSYTPYDAIAMLWAQTRADNSMAWVTSGGAAGRLLVAGAGGGDRPDWVLCTQGVVAGLAARGHDVRIIASVYISDEAILPVFRRPQTSLKGARSLFIPRSSIEFAFDRLLEREGITASEVRVPTVESAGFSTIKSLLEKPVEEADALDFAILVDPFITNLLTERPGEYAIGEGGLYEMHYSVVVRAEDLRTSRRRFVDLLREFVSVSEQLETIASDDDFYAKVWGTKKDGRPVLLPEMLTFSRSPLKLELRPDRLRELLDAEIRYLVEKYPDELRMPPDVEALVDESLLLDAAADRVR